MNDFQAAMIRKQLMRALRISGGITVRVTREETDVNGVPTGDTAEVCRLYGARYQRVSHLAALLAAMPGIAIQNPTAPRFVGVLLKGEMPRPGDTLRIPDNSARIVACQNNLGAISLVLEGGESA